MSLRHRLPVILLLVSLALPTSGPGRAQDSADRTQHRPALQRIEIARERVDVSDGDTVVIRWNDDERERVRVLGIDTPEVAHPRYGQPFDQPLGPEAAAFAAGVFAAADRIELLRAAETDPYGRTLGYLFVNGRNYSVLAVAAGFAVETVSHYGDNGLADEAEAVLAAARAAPPVPFEEPYRFRQRMRALSDWQKDHPAP